MQRMQMRLSSSTHSTAQIRMETDLPSRTGLEQVVEYIENLHFDKEDIDYLRTTGLFGEEFSGNLSTFKFTGDIYAIPEGTVVFPREPLVKVIAPIMQAQLVETAILNIINHQSLIATKTSPDRPCSTRRRSHGVRFKTCPGSGCRNLRCESRYDRRLYRYFQRALRSDVRCPGKRNPCPQLDHEFPG